MSSRLLTALKYLLTAVVAIALAWLAVCVMAMLTGHTDALPTSARTRRTDRRKPTGSAPQSEAPRIDIRRCLHSL